MNPKCALVIERENMGPLIITCDSFVMLSKFKEKLDRKIERTRIQKTSIVGLMNLEDFMSIEEIVKESAGA